MKVFISWSAEQSKVIAEASEDWLPLVIQPARTRSICLIATTSQAVPRTR